MIEETPPIQWGISWPGKKKGSTVSMTGQGPAQGRWIDIWYPIQAEANRWGIGMTYFPPDLLRAFRILIFFTPAADYVATIATEGFWDRNGYNAPGFYPAGIYSPEIYPIGTIINLSAGQQVPGLDGYLLAANTQYVVIQLLTGQVVKEDLDPPGSVFGTP